MQRRAFKSAVGSTTLLPMKCNSCSSNSSSNGNPLFCLPECYTVPTSFFASCSRPLQKDFSLRTRNKQQTKDMTYRDCHNNGGEGRLSEAKSGGAYASGSWRTDFTRQGGFLEKKSPSFRIWWTSPLIRQGRSPTNVGKRFSCLPVSRPSTAPASSSLEERERERAI